MRKSSIFGVCILIGAAATALRLQHSSPSSVVSAQDITKASRVSAWPFAVQGKVWCEKLETRFAIRDDARGQQRSGGLDVAGPFVYLTSVDHKAYALNQLAKLCINDKQMRSDDCPAGEILDGDAVLTHDGTWDEQRLIDAMQASCPSR